MKKKLFIRSLFSLICAFSLAACGGGHKGSSGGNSATEDEPGVEEPTQPEVAKFLLPDGVTKANFTIKGKDGITMYLTLSNVMQEGETWLATMSGRVLMPTKDMDFESNKNEIDEFELCECTIERSAENGIILSAHKESSPLSDSDVAIEINNMSISLNEQGDAFRQGIIENGDFTLYYYSGLLFGESSLNISTSLEGAEVILNGFSK